MAAAGYYSQCAEFLQGGGGVTAAFPIRGGRQRVVADDTLCVVRERVGEGEHALCAWERATGRLARPPAALGRHVPPRACSAQKAVEALRRLDDDEPGFVDACWFAGADDRPTYVVPWRTHAARLQFAAWLRDACEHCASLEELQRHVSRTRGGVEVLAFATREYAAYLATAAAEVARDADDADARAAVRRLAERVAGASAPQT